MWSWIKKLLSLFEEPLERVGRLELYPNGERIVLGTILTKSVERSEHVDLTLYEVSWDDSPLKRILIPSTKFVWYKGMWIMLSSEGEKVALAGRKVRSPGLRTTEKL